MILQAVGLSEITEVESEKESKVEPDQEKTIAKNHIKSVQEVL